MTPVLIRQVLALSLAVLGWGIATSTFATPVKVSKISTVLPGMQKEVQETAQCSHEIGMALSSETPIQGEPVMVTLEDCDNLATSTALVVTFDGQILPVFTYQGKIRALIGIELNKKQGQYALIATFPNGQSARKVITVAERKKIEEPLGIPQKLGGNTKASQDNLISTLAKENAVLTEVGTRTGKKAFWTKPFIFPVVNPVVTDPYGYNRKTGEYTIAHKGTDFHADEGTPVKSMNRGVVRQVRTYTIYGKTIVVDHGLGLQTFYMHLSKIYVNEGELVLPGQIIGLSGQSGYADIPHLHLTVRIGGNSIDPMKFMDLFK